VSTRADLDEDEGGEVLSSCQVKREIDDGAPANSGWSGGGTVVMEMAWI